MLVIRQAQIQVLGKRTQADFQERVIDMLAENYPRECRQAGGRLQMNIFVQQGIEKAAARGFLSQREVILFVTLMMILGAGFENDPQLPWVADLLDEAVIADPTVRIENLFAETIAYLEATAGEDCALLVRAMLRIRDYDLASVPTSQGDAWVTEVLTVLKQFYPQKFSSQGEHATRDMAQAGVRRAAGYGLTDRIGIFVFLECMFMLGSEFDCDPLQPWASAVLNDRAIADESERSQRLYHAAMTHLAQSLSSQ